jgi:hypothetical protein
MSDQGKGQENIDIQHDPSRLNPLLPVEAQMKPAGEPEPIKDQYADSPSDVTPLSSTHDRDSVQPPDPNRINARFAPEMPLKNQEKK